MTKYNKGNQAYKKVPPPYDLKANNYKLGNDKPVYDVSYKTDFGWKDPEIGEQNKALMKDLRGKLI